MTDASPYDLAGQAAEKLAELTGVERHDVALVLGSGWLPAAEMLGETVAEIATTDLPGFSAAAVAGHSGKIRSVKVGDLTALVFLSRTHYYEGKGVAAVVHGVRTAGRAGCRTIVLTNGCGGLKESWTPGTPVLISDHINLTGRSPIEGANFVDLTDLYSSRLRALCREVDPTLDEGVYVQFPGPHYETPAEVRMAGVLGGHLVGMSTTLEAIAAREAGMEVLGLSLVTNLAAGIGGEPLNHEEVLEAGRNAAARMGSLLSQVVPQAVTDTRQRLLDAATRVFAEQGVDTASLLEVARRAGQRNRGAVHYHFGSRDGLLVAVLEQYAGFLAEREGELLARAEQTPDTDLASVVEAVVRPAVELAETGWRGRCYLVVVAELAESDQAAMDAEVAAALARTGGYAVYDLLTRRMPPLRRAAAHRAALAAHRLHPALGGRPRPLGRARPRPGPARHRHLHRQPGRHGGRDGVGARPLP